MTATLLVNAGVFLPARQELVAEAAVLVRDGRFAAVGGAPPRVRDAEIIDLRGKTLLPGLIDMHHHFTMSRIWGPLSAQLLLSAELLLIRGCVRRCPRSARASRRFASAGPRAARRCTSSGRSTAARFPGRAAGWPALPSAFPEVTRGRSRRR